MPKEMLTIALRRTPGQSWGMRIGGGVDRGKVLVLEKVIFFGPTLPVLYIVEIQGKESLKIEIPMSYGNNIKGQHLP